MTLLLALLATYAVVFLINLVPAFMPPTWSVLAFFRIHYDWPRLLHLPTPKPAAMEGKASGEMKEDQRDT